MKDKIIIFIIGFLIGAVLATGIFYLVSKNSNNGPQGNGGTPPQMTNGENGTPPEPPSGTNNNQQSQMPSNNTQSNN